MGIIEYADAKSGVILFKVTITEKSKIIPKIQKQESGIRTRYLAERRYKDLKREAMLERIEREAQGELWGSLLELWSLAVFRGESVEQGLSPIVAQDYVNTLKAYTKHWQKIPASKITRHDIKSTLENVTASGRSSSRKKYLRTAISKVFQWGIDSRLIKGLSDNPAYGIALGKSVERTPSVLSLSETRSLLEAAQRLNHPWYPIWAFALLSGMRSGELHALEWTDVDFENGTLQVNKSYNGRTKSVKCTKSGCWRTVPICSELDKLLIDIKMSAGSRKQVLPRFRDWDTGCQAHVLRQFCTGLGITLIRFHDLRACFATYLLQDAVAPAQVMRICGWKDLKTMQRYVRLAAIEVKGATDTLKILPDKVAMGRVFEIVREG